MLLIFARFAIGVHKIGDGRATHHDRFFQDVLQCAMEKRGLFFVNIRAQLCGVNFCTPQTFVRIDVADSTEHGLIEEKGLDT
jgi:hypothetical protein